MKVPPLLALIAAGALAAQAGPPLVASATSAAGFDPDQARIAQTATDEMIAQIEALKPGHPPLAKFGDPSCFHRFPGGFRYDYKVEKVLVTKGEPLQERPLPGGCFIYFRYRPQAMPSLPLEAPELNDYISGSTGGGARAGIREDFRFAFNRNLGDQLGSYTDPHDAALAASLDQVERNEREGTFARLTSEMVLTRQHIALDVPSLLAAAESSVPAANENPADSLSYNAFVVLNSRPLTPGQWADFRQRLQAGKFQLTSFSVGEVDQLVQKHAPRDRPQILLDMTQASLRTEQAGGDTFQRTPFTGVAWASDARAVRGYIMAQLHNGEPRDIPIAALLLTSDPDADLRISALDYLARQSGAAAHAEVLGALAGNYRGVEIEAAQIAGKQKMADAVPALQRLLGASGSNLRSAAATALKQLGLPAPAAPPVPSVPDAARSLAQTLTQRGLGDDDLLFNHQLMNINAQMLPALDRASVEQAIANETGPKSREPGPLFIREPIPSQFLLAAALKLHDDAAAARIYDAICDDFDTDERALDDATDKLGWDRFAEGLNEFHLHHDAAALPWLRQVLAMAGVARPFSLLSVYIKQSTELSRYLQARGPEDTAPEPPQTDRAAYATYWIARLRDDDGIHPDPAAEKLREMELDGVPYLIAAVTDRTPTRTFSYPRSYLPERDFIYVGDDARALLGDIAQDCGSSLPVDFQNRSTLAPGYQDRLRAFFADLTSRPRPPSAKRRPPILYPMGRYFWGDD